MAERARLPALMLLIVLIITITTVAGAAARNSGTVLRVGSDYTVLPGAEHTGNIMVFGGNVVVDGNLNGRAIAVGGAVRVSGTVTGDIIALGGKAVLSDGAHISGNVTAVGGGIARDTNVELRGEVNSISLSQGLRVPQFRLFPFNLRSFPIYSLYLFGLYLMAIIIAYLFGDQATSIENTLRSHPGRSSIVGALVLVLIIPLTVVMALTVVGLPLVLLTWLSFFVAKLLGYVAVASTIGKLITGKIGHYVPKPLHLALGVVLLGFLRAVPYAGFILGVLVLVSGLGAALMSHFGVGGVWWPFATKRVTESTQPTEPTQQ